MLKVIIQSVFFVYLFILSYSETRLKTPKVISGRGGGPEEGGGSEGGTQFQTSGHIMCVLNQYSNFKLARTGEIIF